MKKNGFSLLELIVAIGLVAILAVIVLPSFCSQSSYLHRLSAELKLLSWQADDKQPVADEFYHYQKITQGSQTKWMAIATNQADHCSTLQLTNDNKEPSDCWPS